MRELWDEPFLPAGLRDCAGDGRAGETIPTGPCTYCKECLGKLDRSYACPQRRTSCLSAYCLDARLMAQHRGIPYWCSDQKAAYFTLFLFDRHEV
ncbi:MAG: DUF2284 domain-containing protein [Blautia hydrogenotrophica]|nr:DUF2284 domain-containing protein [Blautia hydrogenotrophica]MCT6797573.1 hypothetical protein [Blautia hydrogenotrophica]MEE0461915.1 DUF2284 domain-containing protein [Blautia hydrogenotrophica]